MTAAPTGTPAGPLAGLTVLELPGPYGEYAGKLCADLGATVTLVEPPTGAPARRRPPYLDDVPGPERSLWFGYYNAGKVSVVLDLDDTEDADRFRELVATTDVLLDGTGRPTAMAGRRLGPAELRALNPLLVHTIVTPFGTDGPYADWEATDLVLMAMGGLLSLGGYEDGQPTRAYGDQACLAAAQFATLGTLLAVLQAEETGVGQVVDVSAQESVVMAHENAVPYYDLEGVVRTRNGGTPRQAAVGVYPCSDGHVYLLAKGLGVFWPQLVGWLEEEQVDGASGLRDDKWQDDDFAASEEGKAAFAEVFERLSMNRTKEQLYEQAKHHRLPLCPIYTPADLVVNPQLAARGYFVDVHHEGTDRTLRMPGLPYQLSATPGGTARGAPRLAARVGADR